jgi:hypothetical protein
VQNKDDSNSPDHPGDHADTSSSIPTPKLSSGFLVGQASTQPTPLHAESESQFADAVVACEPDVDAPSESSELSESKSEKRKRRKSAGRSVPSSRELLLSWCIWLLISLALSQQLGAFGPSSRWMIFACAAGMFLVWPAVRLSQDASIARYTKNKTERDHKPDPDSDSDPESKSDPESNSISIQQQIVEETGVDSSHHITTQSRLTPMLILRDWLCLLTVFQIVIWTMRYTTGWTIEQAAWLNGTLAAWSLLVALLIAIGCRSLKGTHRTLTMAVILLFILAEPMLMLIDNANMVSQADSNHIPAPSIMHDSSNWLTWQMKISPIDVMYALTTTPIKYKLGQLPIRIICVAAAALIGWLGLLIVHFADRRRFNRQL